MKIKISDALQVKYESSKLSDIKIANTIGGVSDTLINHIRTKRWMSPKHKNLVSDGAFTKVGTWLGVNASWKIVREEDNFKKIQLMLTDAQEETMSFAISAPPGMCKSEASRDYIAFHKNAYFVSCSAHFTKHVFLEKIMQAMGMTYTDDRIPEMVDSIIEKLNSLHNPLLIFDEADKLSDNLLQFFITFYNETYYNSGFMFLGSVFFEKRIMKGLHYNRKGYAEFFSRIGREFAHLKPLDAERISAICEANGLTNEIDIQQVINTCGNDLRAVKRKVEDLSKKHKFSKGQLSIDTTGKLEESHA